MKNLLDYSLPEDLKFMDIKELELLAVQIREFLVDNISKTGGHLASNLGAVELTIALHKAFNSPYDKIIWDVGHQAYVHKILTGRASEFSNLRQFGGISGFPKAGESPHDIFDTGHSSNSISIAAGFAAARDLSGENNDVVAVIGDGSLTGGLSYEGMNNLSDLRSKAIIILNDNGMSIGLNTGGLSKHLNKLRVSKGYSNFKKGLGSALKKVPAIGKGLFNGVSKARDHIKYSIVEGVMFEKLGFTYIGPIDGHDISAILHNLELAKSAEHSVIMHVITKKGKGYRNAENDPSKFHGIGAFNKSTGEIIDKSDKPSYSAVYGSKLVDMARQNDKIVAVSAAMIDGTGLRDFARIFPERTFDVGIAEGHAVAFAGAMAKCGYKPFVTIYSTFLQRGYDNIIMDTCLQNAPVVFAIDRAGCVGSDGETHHGMFDISYLKNLPNMKVLAPSSSAELEMMMEYALQSASPVAVRYPRGSAASATVLPASLKDGSQVISEGKDVMIWAVGNMLNNAKTASNILNACGIDTGVVNARFVAPPDREKILLSAESCRLLVTLEDGIKTGGFGETVASIIAEEQKKTSILTLGWPDKFIEHGTVEQLMDKYGLSGEKIAERIKEKIERKN